MKHLKLIEKLSNNGFRVFVVGGAIRDEFLGVEVNDFDLATNATPEKIIETFRGHKVKLVGKSFGVMIVDDIEIATFRKDRYEGLNHKNCEISFAKTISEDLERRDLTINAVALCEQSGEIVDNFGGISDIKNKIIKFVGNPQERIFEDCNRIIRACRFLAQIDGEFDRETFESLRENAHFVKTHIAPERIRKEILKGMKTQNASLFFSALECIGSLKFIFPELSKCVNHYHGVHHLENIFEHSMIVGDLISNKFPLIKLAGYLHDVGKVESFKNNNGENFAKHEIDSRNIVENDLKRLKFSNSETEKICGLIRCHMYSFNEITPKGVRRVLKKLDNRNITVSELFRLKIADRKGNLNKNPFTLSETKNRLKMIKEELNKETPFSVKSLALSGGEIISLFNLKPSPLISKIQKILLDFIIENGVEFNKKEILIGKVEEVLNG